MTNSCTLRRETSSDIQSCKSHAGKKSDSDKTLIRSQARLYSVLAPAVPLKSLVTLKPSMWVTTYTVSAATPGRNPTLSLQST